MRAEFSSNGHSSESFRPDAPEPLFRAPGEPEPFPIDALPLLLRAGVMGVQGRTQAPTSLCAQSVLAVACLTAAREVDVELSTGQRRPVAQYFATVAKSGERKSSADNEAARPIQEWEEQARSRHSAEYRDWLFRHKAWETREKELCKTYKKDQIQLEDALRQLGAAPLPPMEPMLTCGEPTYEGLWLLLRDGPGAVGVFSAEGGQFVSGHAMSVDNKLKTAAALSELWDGGPVKRVRRGDGLSTLIGRRVCVHLMLQPDAAATFLSDPVLLDQGLLSRVLSTAPQSSMGARFGERTAESERDFLAYLVAMRAHWSSPMRYVPDQRGTLDLRLLRLSEDARTIAGVFGAWVEGHLGESGELRSISGFANKLTEHATRLAGVFTFIEDAGAHRIEANAMKCGVTLARWYASEALRLSESGALSPDLKLAEQVRRWLVDEWREDFVSLPDIYQRGPRAVRDNTAARRVVGRLASHGFLIPTTAPIEVAGRNRREAWRIVRYDPQ